MEVVTEVPRPPATAAFEPDLGHHCTCPECLEWEEDVAHEIATLRERATELEDRLVLLTEMRDYHPLDRQGNPRPAAMDGAGGDASPPPVAEPPAGGETVVAPNPEIEERRERPGRFGGGWIF